MNKLQLLCSTFPQRKKHNIPDYDASLAFPFRHTILSIVPEIPVAPIIRLCGREIPSITSIIDNVVGVL
jgi:hypothetical protein